MERLAKPGSHSWARDIQEPVVPPDHDSVENIALHAQVPKRAAEPLRFLLGDWLVDVPGRRLQRGDAVVLLEPRLMAVLCEFCRHPEEVLSAEALLDTCWPGAASVGDNPVHKAVARLRRALGDCAAAPGHIETIRKRGYRLLAPIRILAEDGARSAGRGWSGGSPFCGLRAFTADHSAVFFGREHEIRSLRDRLVTQWRRQCPLVVLLGPSGSGKTSLVQAGLLPAVLRLPARPTQDRSGAFSCCTAATADFSTLAEDTPWTLLAGALLDWEIDHQPLLSGLSIDHLAGLLSRCEPEVLRLLRVGLVALAGQGSSGHGQVLSSPPLLVLDGIEAVFQRLTREAQAALIATISDLVDSGLIVVLALCRNDFYASLAHHPLLMRDKARGAHMDMAAPDPGAMAQIIRMPARAAGLTYGTDHTGLHRLDDRLCADALQARDALPLLQYTLQELYLRREPGDELTWAAYEALGGLEGAIGSRAEAVLGGLPSARQQALGRLLPRLVGLSADDDWPTGRWVPAADLADEDERRLVDALVEARLFVADHVGGVAGYRVAHEALLRSWPRIAGWVVQHRALLAQRGDLGPWVRRWLQSGRSRELLLPAGPTLWPIAAALVDAPSLFTEDETDFIRRSVARQRRRTRLRGGAVVVSLTLAVGSGLVAWRFATLADMAAERERQSQRMASFMLGDLADQLRPIGQLDVLTRIGEHVLGLLGPVATDDDFTRFSGTPLDRLQRARALVIVGEASGSRGKGHNEASVALLHRARRLLSGREDVRRAAPADYHRTLGAASFWLGQVAFDAGDLTAARADMDLYRQTCEAWRTDLPGNVEADKELSFALSSLGSIAVLSGDWRDAAQWYDRSIELKQAAQKLRPEDPELLDAVANTRTWQGLVAYVLGRPGEALQRYDEAHAVLLRLWADRPHEQSRLRDLGALEVRRAEALRSLGRYRDALVVMGDAVARLRMAEQRDPSNRRWQLERLHAQSGLLLAQIDAGLPVSPSPAVLKQTLQNMGPAAPTESLPQEVLLSLAVAEAAQAVQNGSVGAFRAALDEAERALAVLLRNRPRHWQTLEMQARLRLLELSHLAAIGAEDERRAVSHRTLETLGQAVRGGQAGLLLQAWLAARSAIDSKGTGYPGPDPATLAAGGYQPLTIPTHPRTGDSRI